MAILPSSISGLRPRTTPGLRRPTRRQGHPGGGWAPLGEEPVRQGRRARTSGAPGSPGIARPGRAQSRTRCAAAARPRPRCDRSHRPRRGPNDTSNLLCRRVPPAPAGESTESPKGSTLPLWGRRGMGGKEEETRPWSRRLLPTPACAHTWGSRQWAFPAGPLRTQGALR